MNSKNIKLESFTMPGNPLKANEDVCFVNDKFGFVIDGATGKNKVRITNEESDAKWFSHAWKEFLLKNLSDETLTIKDVVKKGIVEVEKRLSMFENYKVADLKPRAAIAIFRIMAGKFEYFVLADCSLVVRKKDGTTSVITNDDITKLDEQYINLIKSLSKQNNIPFLEAKKLPEVKSFIVEIFKNRNTNGGGWVLSDSLEAVNHAKTGTIELDNVKSVLGFSDGFSQIYDLFKHITPEKLSEEIASGQTLDNYYNILHALQEKDKECEKFLRSKVRDDATAIKYVIEM